MDTIIEEDESLKTTGSQGIQDSQESQGIQGDHDTQEIDDGQKTSALQETLVNQQNQNDLESQVISQLKASHLKECNEIAKHFLDEHEKSLALQGTVEELQKQNEELNEKIRFIEERSGNDSGCEDRDYMNECYLLECEKNRQLGHDVESLRCTVDELRAVVQQVQGKANEQYLLDNLKLRRKVSEQSAEVLQLQETLTEKSNSEKDLETKVNTLEESVDKWRKKQEKSSRKLTEKNVKIRELTEEIEGLKLRCTSRRRLYEVKSSHRVKSTESRALSYRGSEVLLKDEKSSQGLTLTIEDNPPIPPISTKDKTDKDKGNKKNNNNNNSNSNGPSPSMSEIYLRSVIPPILSTSKSHGRLVKGKATTTSKRNVM